VENIILNIGPPLICYHIIIPRGIFYFIPKFNIQTFALSQIEKRKKQKMKGEAGIWGPGGNRGDYVPHN
jgi:hypothetical protein